MLQRSNSRLLRTLSLIIALGATLRLPAGEPRSLFDGSTLAGWRGSAASWTVRDGCITGEIPAGKTLDHNEFLFHETVALKDFELDLEYRISGVPSANSGIQIRSEPHGSGAAGYQADLDDGAVWLGRIYEEEGRALIAERGAATTIDVDGGRFEHRWASAESLTKVARKADWNRYEIKAIGPRIELRVNGTLLNVLEDRQVGQADAEGKLALQLHAGEGPAMIQIRNVRLREIESAAVPERAQQKEPAGDPGRSPEGKNLDFEKGTLEGWTATGNAWKGQPIEGDTVAPRRPGQTSGHAGRFWIGGYERALDAGKGTLTSAPFKVTEPWGSFLAGGGSGKSTRIEILSMPAGGVVFSTGGRDLETLHRVSVDLRAQLGKEIAVRLVDESDGPWGHLNFDDFRFHAEPPLGGRPERFLASPVLRHLTKNASAKSSDPAGITGSFWVPDGFRVDLVAREPEVTQPVAFAIDERGRLWVLEAHSYPQKRDKGLDRIVIFSDEDGDGSFEKRTPFAEGLNLASAIEVGFGGVFVGAAPELLFIPDRNRDDVPDGPPEVLLDGWGFQDTHETLNSFLWGPDGWLYGNQGVFTRSEVGKPGSKPEERVGFNAGVWRYHPVTRAFEVFAHGGSNQWGLDYNELGHLFMTHCRSAWGEGSTTYVVRGGHYWNQANSNHAAFISSGPPGYAARTDLPLRNFLLASARYDHGEGGAGKPGTDAVYGGHSHVGTMIYQGDNWPETYRGQLFTHNLHGHQLNRQMNLADGSGYDTIHAGTDQLFSADPQYMAVDLQYGPDGSVFVIDWTDRQHCHHTSIEQWDRSNGRIYRIVWAPTWKPLRVDLAARSNAELVGLLGHANAWYSRTARRLLQERRAADKLDSGTISKLHADALAGGETSLALSRIWAAHAAGGLGEPELERLLDSADPQVRAWAVTLATEKAPSGAMASRLVEMSNRDASPVVRLALAATIDRLPPEGAWAAATALAKHAGDAGDRWIPGRIWFGLARHVPGSEARALELARSTPLPLLADSIVWYLSLSPSGRDAVAAWTLGVDPPKRERALELLAFALEGKGIVLPPNGWARVESAARTTSTPKLEATLERLLTSFGDQRALARMRKLLADRSAPRDRRLEALRFLSEAADSSATETYASLLDDPALRSEAIPVVGRFGDEKAARRLASMLGAATGEEQSLLASALASRAVMAQALLDALEKGSVRRETITALQARQIATLGDKSLLERLEKSWGKVRSTSEESRKEVAKYRTLYNDAPLWAHDPKDGAQIFTKVCAPCHSMNRKGGNIGPDLGGSGRNGADYFIESIVDPHSVVGEAFLLNVIVLKDGDVLSGMASVSGDRLTLQAPNVPPRTLAQEEIAERQITDQSVMPSGLFGTLSEKEIIDLLKYLTSQR